MTKYFALGLDFDEDVVIESDQYGGDDTRERAIAYFVEAHERQPLTVLIMDPTRALTVIDAVMGDEWAGLTEDEILTEYQEAADVLHRSGLLASLPGRYGRTVQAILNGARLEE